MLRSAVALLFAFALAGGAAAAAEPASPPIVDPLTVTTQRGVRAQSRRIDDFIRSYSAESPSDQISRWRKGVCPKTYGLSEELNQRVANRVREVAGMADAPVGPEASCRGNLIIIFTLEPQPILDRVRAKAPELLGFHYLHDRKKVATVTKPVQAWYATSTEDMNGYESLDVDQIAGIGPPPNFEVRAAKGTRLSQGWSSWLTHVLVVVNVRAVDGMDLAPLTDHIAMLALARTETAEACKALPSIANLMSPDCSPSRKSPSITTTDLAYLQAVYWMNPTLFANNQRGQIAFRMKQILEAP